MGSRPQSVDLTLPCCRVLRHLGCPFGCEEGQRGAPADFLRSQGQSILAKLQRSSQRQFGAFLRQLVRLQPLQDVLDLFHAYVGFCVDPSTHLSPFITCWVGMSNLRPPSTIDV